MFTPVTCRWVACALILFLWSVRALVQAQLRVDSSPHEQVASLDEVTQFLTWQGNGPIQGLAAHLPADWTLKTVHLSDETGRFSDDFVLEPFLRSDVWMVRGEDVLIRPGQRIRLTLQTGRTKSARLKVVPLISEGGRWFERSPEAATSTWNLIEQSSVGRNVALHLTGDRELAPFIGQASSATPPGGSWTLSFWMRSSGLDQIVLSTWTGFESDAYPLETIVDAAGHLTVFTGRDQQHVAMRSTMPTADGTWHHVAVVNDAAERKMRLHIDGQALDSLQFTTDSPLRAVFPPLRLGYRLEDSRSDLSGPYKGDLDELHFFSEPLDTETILRIRKGIVPPSLVPVWREVFDPLASSWSVAEGVSREQLVPSILSFRKAASDLQVKRVPEGILLSFLQGDTSVEQYQIDVSADGTIFRPATTIESNADGGRRIEWMDRTPSYAVQHYRVTALYAEGPGDTAPVIKVGLGTDEPVSRVHLEGNFPNPFNPTTTIRYEVLEQEHVRVSIWDLSGQMIAQPVDGAHQPGHFEVGFDAGTLPSGTYFVRLESPSGIQTHQMILMK
jgi:hypothetical protein